MSGFDMMSAIYKAHKWLRCQDHCGFYLCQQCVEDIGWSLVKPSLTDVSGALRLPLVPTAQTGRSYRCLQLKKTSLTSCQT